MKRSMIVRSSLALFLALIAGVGANRAAERNAAEMAESARRFLSSLTDEQRGRATFAFDSDQRLRFHFIPPETFERQGVTITEMSAAQRERAHDLLRSGLSQRGYMTALQIMEAEGILAMLEGSERQFARDPQAYFVSVFGTPSTNGTWGWRVEGHHLSLHFTVVEGDLTVSTPTFISANPAEVPSGPKKGMRPLARQEDAGRALLSSLSVEQRRVAITDDVAPANILSAMTPVVGPLASAGIAASALDPVQRDLLMDVIEAYTSVLTDEIAALRWAEIRQAGTDGITFAWAGGTARGEVSYFRVQGPTFLIEYDNTQEDPNHIHSGWRDFDGDFGRDVLREHVGEQPH
ncbi:MAG TPA: DUF3500 domain-containing protein [Longimicrobiales bacterium]|nr:DUF3500 domain-containing protein [Longimicrobiales bacterium]